MYAGFLTQNGAARAGWTAFYPLSGQRQHAPGTGMDIWIVGVILVTLAAARGSRAACSGRSCACRAPGMTMLRLPVFTWSMLVTCLMVVTSFPALVVAMALL